MVPRSPYWPLTVLLAAVLTGPRPVAQLLAARQAAAAPRPATRAPKPRAAPLPTRTRGPMTPRSSRPRPSLALQIGHSGRIDSIAFSPDGKTLATGSADNTARLWDVHTGQLQATLQGYISGVSSVHFSPDGKTVGARAADVRLWDAQSGQLKQILQGYEWAFSPDGKRVVTERGTTTVRLWGAHNGQLLATLLGHTGRVGFAFSPDGRTLATYGSLDKTARLWDTPTGRLKVILQGHTDTVRTFDFSPDSQTLATGNADKTARLWDAHTGRLKVILQGHTDALRMVRFSPNGKTLASWGGDKAVRLWDTESGQLKATLQADPGRLYALVFSPDGKMLATASYRFPYLDEGERKGSGETRLWDVQSGNLKAALEWHGTYGATLAFSPDGRTLATRSDENTVKLWDAHIGQLQATLQGHTAFVSALAFSPDGKTLATGSGDGTARLWDAPSGQLQKTLHGQAATLFRVASSPDGKMLATGGQSDHTVRLWDAYSGQLLVTLPGNTPGVTGLAFSPDGKMLATGGIDQTVRLWDVAGGRLKAILPVPAGWVPALAFSPDGKMLATGSGVFVNENGRTTHSGEVRLWDVVSGQLKLTLQGTDWVDAVAFSPDGTTLATAGSDGGYGPGDRYSNIDAVRLWDASSGQLKATLKGHTNWVRTLAFSPDGKTLATGSLDGTARLWDAYTAQLKATLRGHSYEVGAVAFSPEGETLITRDRELKLRRWDVVTGKQIPAPPQFRVSGFPPNIRQPFFTAGAALARYDARDGRLLAMLLPVPEAGAEAAARPIEVGAKPITVGAKAAPAASGEWFVAIPEGYFDCSANAARFIRWNVNGTLYPAERYLRRFRRPDLVRKALRGERIIAAALTADDIPPAVQFVGLKNGDLAPSDPLTVTVEVRDDRDVKEVELLVNGRPLPPEQARPITVGARPIVVGARPIVVGTREGDPNHRIAKQLTFRVPLPLGTSEIHLRATAYDDTDLGSDPVEVVLQRTGAKPVAGNLYVLSVGVSRYRNGERASGAAGERGKGQFPDLRFPAVDARAMAERFQREGQPLYEQVRVRTLVDEQATAENVRAGLKWLQQSVRPGQIDTAVIFLSGHGISVDGRYYFATHETDLKNIAATTLWGRELREALGGKLRAKAVFLFVDTCHAGGLGGRNDDLAMEVGEGVFLLASSGSKEYSYESEQWGHGAFTLALLRALGQQELARDGVIHFNALAFAVPDAVADLMKEAGRNESEQEPCVPLASRRLRVAIAQAAR